MLFLIFTTDLDSDEEDRILDFLNNRKSENKDNGLLGSTVDTPPPDSPKGFIIMLLDHLFTKTLTVPKFMIIERIHQPSKNNFRNSKYDEKQWKGHLGHNPK